MRFQFAVLPIAVFSAFGQTGPTVVGWGSSFHAPAIAPGEIMKLQVSGLNVLSPSTQKAASVPLPNTIAGVSVTVTQTISHSIMGATTRASYNAPLISVDQVNLCVSGTTADCFTTFLTLQMPYELQSNPTSPPIIQSQIVISQNGVVSQAFNVGVVPDQIHVVTSCEDQPWQTGCAAIVTHADGTAVSARSPAVAGETVIVYGWGFGSTTGLPVTGSPSPTPAPVVNLPSYPKGLLLGFDFTPNAAASRYSAAPAYVPAYLTPGSVGLYQANITLPSTFPQLPACGSTITSNLTINLGGFYSFDGAPICVQP
jgi:uncharacterized protein (TIGR03437 family)